MARTSTTGHADEVPFRMGWLPLLPGRLAQLVQTSMPSSPLSFVCTSLAYPTFTPLDRCRHEPDRKQGEARNKARMQIHPQQHQHRQHQEIPSFSCRPRPLYSPAEHCQKNPAEQVRPCQPVNGRDRHDEARDREGYSWACVKTGGTVDYGRHQAEHSQAYGDNRRESIPAMEERIHDIAQPFPITPCLRLDAERKQILSRHRMVYEDPLSRPHMDTGVWVGEQSRRAA